MIRIPLPGADNALLLSPRWGEVSGFWHAMFLLAAVGIPLALAMWLYRYEVLLVSRRVAVLLLAVRVLVLTTLLTVISLQPVVAHYSVEEQTGTVVLAVDRSRSMDVPDPQRTPEEKLALAAALKAKDPATVDQWTRSAIVRDLLGTHGLGLADKLSARHSVEMVTFNRTTHAGAAVLTERKLSGSDSSFTDLGAALNLAAELAARKRVVGVVLFSDGQHNTGPAPAAKARELGVRGVPVYPVAIGSRRSPADIAVRDIKAPSNTFVDAECLIEARVHVTGLPAGKVRVELQPRGKPLKPEFIQTLPHDGRDRDYPVRFQIRLDEVGTHAFDLKALPESKEVVETTTENNSASTVTRVVRDKAKVLLVDGEPRWEYHYLATLLARDREVAVERVLFQQPRIGGPKAAPAKDPGLPASTLPQITDAKSDPLLDFECIVLGDVTPAELPSTDRRRLEQYVNQTGGTLILIAGKRALPFGFLEQSDPLWKMMPLLDPRTLHSEKGFRLQLTPEGEATTFLRIDSENPRRWTELPTHHWAISGTVKPGARVLARSTAEDKSVDGQPLIVEHNYGFGRVLWVGIDSTWRWRFRVGDVYHHRFWGQLIRWAAADKLLPAGNQYVRYGTREPVYQQGNEVHLSARLSHELKPPAGKTSARLLCTQTDGKETPVAEVSLRASSLQPQLLEGRVRDLAPGDYRIELDIPELKDKLAEITEQRGDTFSVVPPDTPEMADLSTNWTLMETIAKQSKGELLTPETVHKLVDLFERRITRVEHRTDEKIWQDSPSVWLMLAGLLFLLTLEWVVRKLAGLP